MAAASVIVSSMYNVIINIFSHVQGPFLLFTKPTHDKESIHVVQKTEIS